MNAIETHSPDPNHKYNHAEAEWKRLVSEGERHMLGGNYAAARAAYLAALSYAKLFAPTFPFWNKTLANLRYLYINYVFPRTATVAELVVATVPEWESVLGENHFFIALWLEKYVKIAEDAEKYALAEQMYRKMLACLDVATYLATRAREMRQLPCLHGIGRARFAQGDYAEAAACFADCIKRMEATAGQFNPGLVVYLEDAAEVARQRGDTKLEEQYTKRALWIRRYHPAAFSRPVRPNRNSLADVSRDE